MLEQKTEPQRAQRTQRAQREEKQRKERRSSSVLLAFLLSFLSVCSVSSVLSVVLLPSPSRADDPERIFSNSRRPDDERLYEAHDVDHPTAFHPHFKSRDEWQHRATELREQVLVAEGLWPLPPKTDLHPVIHGKIDRDEYTIEKVFFASYPGFYVTGNLYRPKNRSGKLPGVLCPHGHWNNGRFYDAGEEAARKQIEIGAEKT